MIHIQVNGWKVYHKLLSEKHIQCKRALGSSLIFKENIKYSDIASITYWKKRCMIICLFQLFVIAKKIMQKGSPEHLNLNTLNTFSCQQESTLPFICKGVSPHLYFPSTAEYSVYPFCKAIPGQYISLHTRSGHRKFPAILSHCSGEHKAQRSCPGRIHPPKISSQTLISYFSGVC